MAGTTPSADEAARSKSAKLAGWPSGTVTFLFTAIAGSAQLWEQHPQAMPRALARQELIVRQAVAAHGGITFKTSGDNLYAAFSSAPPALAAALAAQRAFPPKPGIGPRYRQV
jgi:class 3 adenylate cyclase